MTGIVRFLCVCILLVPKLVFGQRDTSHTLAPVEVNDLRNPSQNPVLFRQTLSDTATIHHKSLSLADALSQGSSVFVKQYSPGMLASVSFRGTSAAHTAIVWNGINLNSSMNGQADFSLIPAMLFGGFSLQQGASPSTWGSGAIGGVVQLDPVVQPGVRVLQETGSFGHSITALQALLARRKWVVSVASFRRRSDNDFQYRNTAHSGHPLMRQTNASVQADGILASASLVTGKSHRLKLSGWWQNTNREIPPIMSIPLAVAKQNDANLRLIALWTQTGKSHEIKVRVAWLNDVIHFSDSLFQIDTHNESHTWVQEAEFVKHFGNNHTLQLGINRTFSRAESPGFGDTTYHMDRRSVFLLWESSFWKKRILVRPSFRKEWTESMAAPFAPSVGMVFQFTPTFSLNAQGCATYRIPTLNDLYWQPGGNPNLLPENGNSQEAGLQFDRRKTKSEVLLRLDAFRNAIHNWILWMPGSSFWTPHNVRTVRSKGLNLFASVRFKINKQVFQLQSTAQWVRAIPESSPMLAVAPNRQLMYVPEYTANQNLSWSAKGFTLAVMLNYTGERFVSSDNTEKLPAFVLLGASLEKRFHLGRHSLDAYVRANNLTGVDYQVISWRPMPLQTIQGGLSIFLNLK